METSSPTADDTPVVALSNPLPNPDPTPTPAPGTNNDDPNAYVEKLFRNWAKNSRLAFLNRHLSTYRERINQGTSRANDYAHEVVQEYFKCYHWKLKISDEPSEDDRLQVESDELLSPIELKQKSQKILAMQKAIKSWLDYRAKSSRKVFVHRGKLENNEWARLLCQLSGVRKNKPKALQAHQRWSKDHFETDIKHHFLKKWRKAGLPSKKMATFCDEITHKHFKKLSEEEQNHWRDTAQDEGKAAVKEWKAHLEAPPSTSPVDRQAALDNLATFAGPILAGMSEILGMHVSLLVGGPEPRKRGKITVVSMHEGVDLSTKPCNWQTRDRTKFKTVIKSFQDYLSHAYTKHDCDSRRLPDDVDDLYTMSQEGDQSDAEEDQATKTPTARYRSRTKSKQQGTKWGRVSRRKPSSECPETDGSSSESSSPSSSSSSSSSSSTSSSSTDSEEEHGSRQLPFSPRKGNYGVTHFSPRHKAAAHRQLKAKKSHLASEGPDHLSEVSRPVSEVPDDTEEIEPPAPIASASATATELPADNPIPRPPFNDHMIDPCLRDDSGIAAPATEIPSQDQIHEPVDSHDMDDTPSAERDTEGAVDDRHTPLNATLNEHTVNSNWTANTSPDGNLSLSLPTLPSGPPWFKNRFQQLMNPAPTSPQLIQLFDKLVRLEDASSFVNEKAALGCEHRPVKVHWWISRGRKGKPTIPDLNTFISQWWSWWLTLQPEWRKCQVPTLTAGPIFPRTDDSSWDKPGVNGMLSVVATLKWWADDVDGEGYEDSRWKDAADDVMWVLDQLIATRSMSKSMASSGNKKWGRSNTQANAPSSKRMCNRQ